MALGHVAMRKCVIGFQIDNETKHCKTASEHVQKLFVEYLKEKFGTVQALNQLFVLNYWSNAIADWEDFPDMRGCVNGDWRESFLPSRGSWQRISWTGRQPWSVNIKREGFKL